MKDENIENLNTDISGMVHRTDNLKISARLMKNA
jgi:hypothetical protein